MRTPQTITLPIISKSYDPFEMEKLRRTVEQTLQDLRSDIVTSRDFRDAPSSLSMRSRQFLLMGA
jgi:hypothetical protein